VRGFFFLSDSLNFTDVSIYKLRRLFFFFSFFVSKPEYLELGFVLFGCFWVLLIEERIINVDVSALRLCVFWGNRWGLGGKF
jgi:hypothetical protein